VAKAAPTAACSGWARRIGVSALFLAIGFWTQAASSVDYDAIAAARQFFSKVDRGDLHRAYDQFSASAKEAVGYEAWLRAFNKPGGIGPRRFTSTTTYDQPEGKLIAVEFVGMYANGDKECGYIVVDAMGAVVRVDSTTIPAQALSQTDGELGGVLSDLPGCK